MLVVLPARPASVQRRVVPPVHPEGASRARPPRVPPRRRALARPAELARNVGRVQVFLERLERLLGGLTDSDPGEGSLGDQRRERAPHEAEDARRVDDDDSVHALGERGGADAGHDAEERERLEARVAGVEAGHVDHAQHPAVGKGPRVDLVERVREDEGDMRGDGVGGIVGVTGNPAHRREQIAEAAGALELHRVAALGSAVERVRVVRLDDVEDGLGGLEDVRDVVLVPPRAVRGVLVAHLLRVPARAQTHAGGDGDQVRVQGRRAGGADFGVVRGGGTAAARGGPSSRGWGVHRREERPGDGRDDVREDRKDAPAEDPEEPVQELHRALEDDERELRAHRAGGRRSDPARGPERAAREKRLPQGGGREPLCRM